MKFKPKSIIRILLFILAIGYILYLQFTNIDMTKTRFMLTYWKQITLVFVVTFSATFFLGED